MPAILLICSLSFVGFFFECPVVVFDVSRYLAVVADSVVPGLVPASLIVRRSGRTSSPVVRSVGRTLYYISFLCRVFGERLSPSCFSQDCARDFGVLDGSCSLHIVVTKVSQEEGRLLMSIIALNSSSIVIPCDKIWELKLSYSLRCA